MRELLGELMTSLDQGHPCVYCAVVETRGSTPQKAGAAMLVFPDGRQSGTLGGGCVEAEVKQRALRVLAEGTGRADVHTFNLDDNYGWDDGLICGGRMSILAEPLVKSQESGVRSHEAKVAYFYRLRERVEAGKGCTEAAILNGPAAGNRFLFDATGGPIAQTVPGDVPADIGKNLVPLEGRPRPYHRSGVAYLPILPRITLLIVGGGHVGHAVARLAAELDFEVWVLDDRERYITPERFPTAARRLVGDIGQKLRELRREITPSHYAIIVTRGHAHDEEALYHLAESSAGYIGMIGSKRKIKLIHDDLIARNIPAEALARVHAPLGFVIGSQTVPEIAVSIAAELISHRNLGRTEQVHHKDAKVRLG